MIGEEIETYLNDSLEKLTEIVNSYYPNKELKAETLFQLEEILAQ